LWLDAPRGTPAQAQPTLYVSDWSNHFVYPTGGPFSRLRRRMSHTTLKPIRIVSGHTGFARQFNFAR
jgi:hypothetical protein